jgi:acetyl esterase
MATQTAPTIKELSMPVDSEIAQLLRTLEGLPPMDSLSVDAMRASMLYPPPEQRRPVGRVEDIAIPADGHTLRARLYRPAEEKTNGMLVFFHGGGFVIGNLETHDHVCREFCAYTGSALLAVDYRLAPEHRFPLATDDCLRATRWVGDEARALGIDADRLVLIGDSAGANLATVTALRLRDEGGPAVRAQALIYPVTDYHTPPTASYIENQTGYSLTRAAMIRFWAEYLADASQGRHPHAAPLRATELSGLPPTLVQTAEFDPLRDEGEAYAHRLLDAGVQVTLWREAGLIHGFVRMGLASRRAQTAIERCAQWVSSALG